MRVIFSLHILWDLIFPTFKHGIYDVRVLAKLDPITLKMIQKTGCKIGLPPEHIGVLVKEDLDELDYIVGSFTFEEFFSDMSLSHISTINFFLSESSLNSVILK